MRQGILAAEKAEARIDYLQAEIAKLEREVDDDQLNLYKSLNEKQRRSRIRWN